MHHWSLFIWCSIHKGKIEMFCFLGRIKQILSLPGKEGILNSQRCKLVKSMKKISWICQYWYIYKFFLKRSFVNCQCEKMCSSTIFFSLHEKVINAKTVVLPFFLFLLLFLEKNEEAIITPLGSQVGGLPNRLQLISYTKNLSFASLCSIDFV